MTHATIAPLASDIASSAADLFRARDKLAADLAALDLQLRQHTREYGTAVRKWAMTPLMLRQACEALGLLDKKG